MSEHYEGWALLDVGNMRLAGVVSHDDGWWCLRVPSVSAVRYFPDRRVREVIPISEERALSISAGQWQG